MTSYLDETQLEVAVVEYLCDLEYDYVQGPVSSRRMACLAVRQARSRVGRSTGR